MSNLQNTVTTLSVLKLALKDSSAGNFAKNFTSGILQMQKSLLDFQRKKLVNKTFSFLGNLPGVETIQEEGRTGFRPMADATIAQRLAFEKLKRKY
jgi:hypothetical protein